MEFLKHKKHVKHLAFSLTMRCFGDVFEKNIDVDVFDDVLQNAIHRANDAPNDVNRPPLPGGATCIAILHRLPY